MTSNYTRFISRMSIRARVAFGLFCVERAVRQFGGSEARAKTLFDKLWTYTSASDLNSWGCKLDVEQLETLFESDISRDRLEVLSLLFEELDEIGGGNLFGGFRDEFTLKPTLNLLAIMQSHDIDIPPTDPFIRVSPRRFWNAWGRPFPREAIVNQLPSPPKTHKLP